VKAGIVREPRDYRWSSYRAYAYGRRDFLVDEHPIYQEFSRDELERRRRYREFVGGMLRIKDAMRGEMNRRAIYGGEIFVGYFKKNFEIEGMIRPIGRPKKKDKKIEPSPFAARSILFTRNCHNRQWILITKAS